MRIAQVAPLYESVPPLLYGGTERVVAYLTDELVRQGHEVTLYASGDSRTTALLRPVCDRALRLGGSTPARVLEQHRLQIRQVLDDSARFDMIHFHLDDLPFPVIRRHNLPAVSTLHGRLDVPEFGVLLREYNDMHLISISDAQRTPIPWANWVETVYNGLPESLHWPTFSPDDYLAFIGRIAPEKGVDLAIEIARRAGMRLRIAAKIDAVDRAYFQSIRNAFRQPHVEFLGEIDESQKTGFLGNARALLFPIDWPEPFGLVMIEALACATPIIAFRRGSVEEVLEDGVTAFIVDSVNEAVSATDRIDSIDRKRCRAEFERRFSARLMCLRYIDAYQSSIARKLPAGGQGQLDTVPLSSVPVGHASAPR